MNRELDRQIAERVMGLRVRWSAVIHGDWMDVSRGLMDVHVRRYSEDIAAAFQVVEKLNRRMEVDYFPETKLPWCVMFVNADGEAAWAKTLPQAICLAALAALKTQATNAGASPGTTLPDEVEGSGLHETNDRDLDLKVG